MGSSHDLQSRSTPGSAYKDFSKLVFNLPALQEPGNPGALHETDAAAAVLTLAVAHAGLRSI